MEAKTKYLERVLHSEIPITRALGIEIIDYDGSQLTVKAPIAKNLNHISIAFGGSLFSVAVLSGWGLIYLKLLEEEISANIIIQRSNVSFERPVVDDITAYSQLPDYPKYDRFVRTLRAKGKSRIVLKSAVLRDDNPAVLFDGTYVAAIKETA